MLDASSQAECDRRFMAVALSLARRGLGRVAPNPAVGCIIVQGDRVIARGWTQPGGRPHAEAVALKAAGEHARGASVYVTLEPCAHYGQTPPCAEALVKAGVARVITAMEDPDPRVSGGGHAMLAAGGVAVTEGVMRDEAASLNLGFTTRIDKGRPLVTVKLATSLDARIATASGESRWITGEPARRLVHRMRAETDAVLTGRGTVALDDPALTCRLPGLRQRSPIRIVVDSHLSGSPDRKLFATATEVPSWIVTTVDPDDERAAAFRAQGVEVIQVPAAADGRCDLAAAFQALGARGLTRLLVEAGGTLVGGLLRAGLCDRIVWMRAPRLIGGDGRPAITALGIANLDDTPQLRLVEVERAGDDVVETWERSA